MGIPKFYRWLSERYPLINQPGGATVVPIIDNFYLDMNGIIHNCTHGNNPDVKMTEDEMVIKIFGYLDKLFHIVKPQKVIFMAIDGVAPRAKMNQQRARRFKAAKEAEEAKEEAMRRGESADEASSRFDSNCITPGTPFMARLGAHFRFFIRKKISEDPAWQKPTVIFSGHEVPGEGEHKIMEYIRWAKRTPGYAPNTRHCLYGLDADLIMLSLVTHEPHFCLLREVVSFSGGGRGQPAREVLENPCQEHFVLLQIGLLRDYFDMEFKVIAKTLPFAYDLERIIDDFVLFCMLVGNDFLPPLPTVDINEGSLDSMFDLYRKMLPALGGYVTHAGDLHRGRLELLMKALADQEADILESRAQETEDFESKKASRGKGPAWGDAAPLPVARTALKSTTELDDDDAFALEMAKLALRQGGHELELLALEEGDAELTEVDGEVLAAPVVVPAVPTMMSREARDMFLSGDKVSGLAAWRSRYYREKLEVTEEQRRTVLEHYIQGLHWVLEYYYRGVASWNWYYPHHYAPMASDFVDLAKITVSFTIGEPFLPFEQLLAVQPSSSHRLLPEPYKWLMTDPNSPIADFYPVSFEVDLEGKRAEWEGVVKISFIDEQRLLKAARSVPPTALTAEERLRNSQGDIMVFSLSVGSKEDTFCVSTLPAHYSSVARCNSVAMVQAAPPPLPAGAKGFIPACVAGTKVGATGPPGFPTLRTLAVYGELRRAGINVFGTTSRKESLILKMKELSGAVPTPTAALVGSAVVGQRAWVQWPYLQEAMVVAVSDGKTRAGVGGEVRPLTPSEAEDWSRQAAQLTNEYLSKHGVELGALQLLLHVRPCEGLVRQIDGTVEKRFGKTEAVYPLQVTLRRNPSPDPRFQADGALNGAAGIEQMKAGERVMFLGRAHYGCMATLLPSGPRGLDRKGKALLDAPSSSSSSGGGGGGGGDDEVAILTPPYRVEVTPAPANAAQAGQAARRILSHVQVVYQPSGQVARRLGVNSRTLGRMTGNVWVQLGEERRDRADVGLCIKNNAKGLFVPDYCAPAEPRFAQQQQQQQQQQQGVGGEQRKTGGWGYSDAMVRILEQYKQKFSWMWSAVEKQEMSSSSSFGGEGGAKSGGPPQALTLEELFPGMDKDAALTQVAALRKWLKSTPLGRRPLVKPTAKVAPESAVRMLQAAMPPKPKELPPVELENVSPALLLPPLVKGGTASAFAGGSFELADRVTFVGSAGAPAFGSRGTVVGIYDEAVEVLFDQEFLGGNDLFGRCSGDCGTLLPPDQLLNLSHPHAVKAEGALAPKVVRKSGAAAAVNGSGSNVWTARSAAAASSSTAAPMSADAALAAASAALQNTKKSSKAASSTTTAAAAVVEKQAPPRIPDNTGIKGFAMGRGQRRAPQPSPAATSIAAPGSQVGTSNSSNGNAGAALLAQLNRSATTTTITTTAPPPPQPPQHMMPRPPPMMMMPMHPGMPMPMPPPPPGHYMPMMMPGPPPPPGMMPMHMPMPMMMMPPGPPPPPGTGAQQGNALLAHLTKGATAATTAAAPTQSRGSLLLSQLQASATSPQKIPPPPPTSAGAVGASAMPTSPNAGALLLQQLKKQATATSTPPAASAVNSNGNGSMEALLPRVQIKKNTTATTTTTTATTTVVEPPMPPLPSAMMLGEAPPTDADALWKLMSNAGKEK